MKSTLHSTLAIGILLATSLALATVRADERGKLIFEDHFDRQESQETTDEIGNGWKTNSKARAGGHKQADLRDGALYIFMHPTADHAVSVTHGAEFQDGAVELRFLLEHDQDKLGLDFADLQLKTVHAGHLFKVTVGAGKLEIADLKTGVMSLPLYEARKAGAKATPETQKLLATKRKIFPVKLETGKWHTLLVRMAGDAIAVSIDGHEAGTFASEGFAHPTKRMLRLAVPHQAVVDDLKIFAAK